MLTYYIYEMPLAVMPCLNMRVCACVQLCVFVCGACIKLAHVKLVHIPAVHTHVIKCMDVRRL